MRKSVIGMLAVVVAAMSTLPAPAASITYTGSRSVAGRSISLSLTTDGTLGVLAASNFSSFDIAVSASNPFDSFTYNPMTANLFVIGDALSATPTSLTFNFGSSGSDLFQVSERNGQEGLTRFYCIEAGGGCLGGSDGAGPSNEAVYSQFSRTTFVNQPGTGIAVLGTAVPLTSGAPEPSAWAMLLAGFGLAGSALRRRRRFVAA